jgi:hypothetical protein
MPDKAVENPTANFKRIDSKITPLSQEDVLSELNAIMEQHSKDQKELQDAMESGKLKQMQARIVLRLQCIFILKPCIGHSESAQEQAKNA